MPEKIVIGISGASGSIYADQLLEFLKKYTDHQVEIIATNNGKRILREEINKDVKDYDYSVIPNHDYNNCQVSGSSVGDQMIIVPASMGCIARIAHGISSDTLTRTADVFIKEKKPLIIVPRETPFSLIHLRNLTLLAESGVTIIPAIPSFYSQPKNIDELAKTVTSRILDHMKIKNDLTKRWQQK